MASRTLVAVLSVASLANFFISPVPLDLYPWNGRNVYDQSEELLESLRKKMTLEVLGDAALESIRSAPNQELFIKNLEGITFKYSILPESALLPPPQKELTDPKALNSALEGVCAIMPADYWSYEWCHKREFSQFHVEQRGNKFVKAPDWSLGKYYKTVVHRDTSQEGVDDANAPIVKLVDYFKDGQHCEENNQHRSVEVHIQCCDGTHYPNYINSAAYHSNEEHKPHHQLPRATLNFVAEPQLCTYQAIVCTALLCPREPAKRTSSKRGGSREKDEEMPRGSHFKSYVDFIRQVEPLCLVKAEDWWTYEVCFNKGVRQIRFNLEQSVSPEGVIVQKQVLVNQYTLGVAPTHVYKNETALVLCSTSTQALDSLQVSLREQELLNQTGLLSPLLTSRKTEPQSLSLAFLNGTPCDLDRVNRSTIVDVSCGASNQIVSVSEERTCEYRIKVELKLACLLPGFLPEQEKVTVVGLTLVDAVDEAEGEAEVSQSVSPPAPPKELREESVSQAESDRTDGNIEEVDVSHVGDAQPTLKRSRGSIESSLISQWLSRSPEERERARRNIEITLDDSDDLPVKDPKLYNLLVETLAALDEIDLLALTKQVAQQEQEAGRGQTEVAKATPQSEASVDTAADPSPPSPPSFQGTGDVTPLDQHADDSQAVEGSHTESRGVGEGKGQGRVDEEEPQPQQLLRPVSATPQETAGAGEESRQTEAVDRVEGVNESHDTEGTDLERRQEHQSKSSTTTNSAPVM